MKTLAASVAIAAVMLAAPAAHAGEKKKAEETPKVKAEQVESGNFITRALDALTTPRRNAGSQWQGNWRAGRQNEPGGNGA